VLRLLRGGEMTAGELAERFDMTKPSMSHHFAVLKQADLVGSRRDGQQVYYYLNTTVVEDVLAIIWGLFSGNGDGKGPEEGSGS
jgi:ArsR family transcriptional regulator, repressor of sdpIR and other operons